MVFAKTLCVVLLFTWVNFAVSQSFKNVTGSEKKTVIRMVQHSKLNCEAQLKVQRFCNKQQRRTGYDL